MASSVSPQTPVLGDNVFRLQCTFTLTANNPVEQLLGLTLMRKKSTDQDFQNILVFNPPSLNVAPSYIDTSLETRTTVKWPDTSLSTSATLTFNNTLCSDIADYKWEYTYFQSPAGTLQDSSTNVVDVKGGYTYILNHTCNAKSNRSFNITYIVHLFKALIYENESRTSSFNYSLLIIT